MSELPPSLVLLFNWSFIGDNQFIPSTAPGSIDPLSRRKVKCALPLPISSHVGYKGLILVFFLEA